MDPTSTRAPAPASRLARGPLLASWVAQLVAAAILGMTLPAKFSGAADAAALFEQLGVEPWGRIGLAAVEAITVVLLLVPRTALLGGLATTALMLAAVGSHLTVLGVSLGEADGGSMFVMALVALLSGLAVVGLRRREFRARV